MSGQIIFQNPHVNSGQPTLFLNSPYTFSLQPQSVMFGQLNQKQATPNQVLWPNQANQLTWNAPQGSVPGVIQPNASQGFQQQMPQITFGTQQQQPSPFGQQQPSIFGQQQASVFGQQQASVFGQQQPSVAGQQQTTVFVQQQPGLFGQQQPFGAQFGQQPNFVQPVQATPQPNWCNFGQQPQLGQQNFSFPNNQNVQQMPQQFFQTQQVLYTQVVDQNGQIAFVPTAYNNLNGYPPAPTTVTDNQTNWNTIGMLPAAILNTAINGRGPSLFSTDPAFDSPLYTWKRNPSNWKRYPDGLNSSLASTFIDPPGLWTLPSASSYLPKRPPAKTDQHNSGYKRASYLPNTLFEERDMTFQQWNNALKRTQSTENVKKRQFLRNADTYQRFKLAYENDEAFQSYPEGAFSTPLRRDDNDPKRLNPQLVRELESLRGPRKRTSLNHPAYKLGQQYVRDEDHSKLRGPKIELVVNPDSRESPSSGGLFDQPTPGKIPWYLKATPVGPPKDNSFEYCSEDPWLTRQKIYNQLVRESSKAAGDFTARLPKIVYRNQNTPEQSPRSKTRIWSEPMENPADVRTPPHRPHVPTHPRSSEEEYSQTTSTVIMTRPGYYCIPDKAILDCCVDRKGQCIVEDFEVGHKSFGKVKFPGVINVAGLNLDKIIHFKHKEFVIYPDGLPPYGQGLHREGIVTLFDVYPTLRDNEEIIRDPKIVKELRFENFLRKACFRCNGQFLGYDSTSGLWVFKIQSPPRN